MPHRKALAVGMETWAFANALPYLQQHPQGSLKSKDFPMINL
jgi:hypothetical protein